MHNDHNSGGGGGSGSCGGSSTTTSTSDCPVGGSQVPADTDSDAGGGFLLDEDTITYETGTDAASTEVPARRPPTPAQPALQSGPSTPQHSMSTCVPDIVDVIDQHEIDRQEECDIARAKELSLEVASPVRPVQQATLKRRLEIWGLQEEEVEHPPQPLDAINRAAWCWDPPISQATDYRLPITDCRLACPSPRFRGITTASFMR